MLPAELVELLQPHPGLGPGRAQPLLVPGLRGLLALVPALGPARRVRRQVVEPVPWAEHQLQPGSQAE